MFLVGGGILTHGLVPLHHGIEGIITAASGVPSVGAALAWIAPLLINAVVGMAAGALMLAGVVLYKKSFGKR